MRLKFISFASVGILCSLLAQVAAANLLINPTRVHFGSNDRATDVTLINTSQTTNTYRIEWAEKKANEAGGYTDLTEATAASFPIASSMLRYSPRQVTLKPGERQTVKLAIRRPQDLADGEYRSHLMFRALAPATQKDQINNDAPSLQFNIVLSFAIPVVVVQGPVKYEVAMSDAAITYDPTKKDGLVSVSMTRSGTNSVTGNMSAYWTPNGGKERLIAKLSDYNFWPEINKTKVDLAWVGTEFAPQDGKLRIVYEGAKEFHGKNFFEKTIDVKRSMIKTAN